MTTDDDDDGDIGGYRGADESNNDDGNAGKDADADAHLTGAPLPWAGRSSTVIVLSVSLSGEGMSP